jgi:hypothetical protein
VFEGFRLRCAAERPPARRGSARLRLRLWCQSQRSRRAHLVQQRRHRHDPAYLTAMPMLQPDIAGTSGKRGLGYIVGTCDKDAGPTNQRLYLNGARVAQMSDTHRSQLSSPRYRPACERHRGSLQRPHRRVPHLPRPAFRRLVWGHQPTGAPSTGGSIARSTSRPRTSWAPTDGPGRQVIEAAKILAIERSRAPLNSSADCSATSPSTSAREKLATIPWLRAKRAFASSRE